MSVPLVILREKEKHLSFTVFVDKSMENFVQLLCSRSLVVTVDCHLLDN